MFDKLVIPQLNLYGQWICQPPLPAAFTSDLSVAQGLNFTPYCKWSRGRAAAPYLFIWTAYPTSQGKGIWVPSFLGDTTPKVEHPMQHGGWWEKGAPLLNCTCLGFNLSNSYLESGWEMSMPCLFQENSFWEAKQKREACIFGYTCLGWVSSLGGGKEQILAQISCCCSVTQLCPTLCDPMHCSVDCSQTSLSFTVSWSLFRPMSIVISDAIQSSHPLTSSFPAFSLSQDWGSFPVSWLFASCGQSIVA